MTASLPLITILNPLKLSEIPPESTIIDEGVKLISSTSEWKKGNVYFGNVQTYYRAKGPGDGAPWHCRVSEHEIEFDLLWKDLSEDKAIKEMNYVHDINKVTKVKDLSPTAQIWTLDYKFPPPVSPRVFTILQVVHLIQGEQRVGIIVSVCIDLSSPGNEDLVALEGKGVRGRYVSVERVQELESGKTEWRMATSSSGGGKIPSFLAEWMIPKKIAADVPQFMKWYKSMANKSEAAIVNI